MFCINVPDTYIVNLSLSEFGAHDKKLLCYRSVKCEESYKYKIIY